MLDECRDANEMLRTFNKVNALFVRKGIKDQIAGYQARLIEQVKSSVDELDSQFTNQYADSQACLMSRMRDMTDTSGAIVWATQMQRQLQTYSKQVETILGEDWQQDELGKGLVDTTNAFKKKLTSAIEGKFKDWLELANEDRQARLANHKVFLITKVNGIYEVSVNFDDEVATLLDDYRTLQGIGAWV